MMPLQGFIAPRDPRWLSTLAAMDRELVSGSLVYRYNPSASPGGGIALHELGPAEARPHQFEFPPLRCPAAHGVVC
jgi:hypothetical protein